MEKSGSFCDIYICAELCSKHSCDVADLKRVFKHVLAVACAVIKASERFYELFVQIHHAHINCCVFALFFDFFFNFFLRFFDHFLDSDRVDTSVRDEFFKSDFCNLSSDRVKAG